MLEFFTPIAAATAAGGTMINGVLEGGATAAAAAAAGGSSQLRVAKGPEPRRTLALNTKSRCDFERSTCVIVASTALHSVIF
jgi:hypothetical protein